MDARRARSARLPSIATAPATRVRKKVHFHDAELARAGKEGHPTRFAIRMRLAESPRGPDVNHKAMPAAAKTSFTVYKGLLSVLAP